LCNAGIPEPDSTVFGRVVMSGGSPGDVTGLVIEAKAILGDDSPGDTIASYALGDRAGADLTEYALRIKVDNGTAERPNAIARGDHFALFVEGRQVSDTFTAGGADSLNTLFRRVDIDLEPGLDFFRWGDVDCPLDAAVNTADARTMLGFSAGTEPSFVCINPDLTGSNYPAAGDVSGDGVMGTVDAALVLQQEVGSLTFFPVDENQSSFGPDLQDPQPFEPFNAPGSASIELSDVSELIDNRVQMPLNLQSADNILGWSISITFDSNILAFDRLESTELTIVNPVADTPGLIQFAGATPNTISGSAQLGELFFTPLGSLETETIIVIESSGSALNDGQATITSTTDGRVLISPAQSTSAWVSY
jgi:hypothetical protein